MPCHTVTMRQSQEPDARLAAARSALARGEWTEALDLLHGPSADGDADALEMQAQAAYGAGDLDGCIDAWQRLHRLHRDASAPADAARAASMVALHLMIDTGLMASVRGWLRRAERLVADDPDDPTLAVVAMTRSYERLMCGDTEGCRRAAESAIALGERLDVPAAVVVGRVASARVLILSGQVDEGLDVLDEVCSILVAGDVDALTTGMMYCELICAAQGLGLVQRAAEWTESMERWRHGAAIGGITGRCRVHRAEMLRTSGPGPDAEHEALRACDELRPWMRREFGWPLVELGNIRLRRGDLDGAEEAFLDAHDHAWSPQPGLALLRLEQGDSEAAAELIAESIDNPFDMPSKERPPFGDLRLAPLLDAQAEIACARSDAETARRAADQLTAIAARYDSDGLRAASALARARASLLADDLSGAAAEASHAMAVWTEVGAPFEASVARVVLADACERSGRSASARLHRRAARESFERFGASRWLERLDRLEPAPSALLREVRSIDATFRAHGNLRTIGFDGSTAVVRDLKGLRYVEQLLAAPGREHHVLDMVAVEQGSTASDDPDSDSGVRPHDGSGMPAIDDQAKAAYRQRLAEVEEDIDDARRANDLARLEHAERDKDFLVAELGRAMGLGGRTRLLGGDAERARTSVTRAIRYGLDRLAEDHPAAAAHLDRSIQTGTFCVYSPDPSTPIVWLTRSA
jgi:hypothetical protein